jgi:hypothetical protein
VREREIEIEIEKLRLGLLRKKVEKGMGWGL